jgi:hypothetical protein
MAAVDFGTAVIPGEGAKFRDEKSGLADLPAGKWVYKSSTDGLLYLASDATLATSLAIGVTVNGAKAINQDVRVQWKGKVTNTATLPVGDSFTLSDTPGSGGSAEDLGTGDWVTNLGIVTATTEFDIAIQHGKVQHA